ncbi:MAG: LysE family translocator [Chloroflexi bacterium]|nr:LysE family translocator [Chloroflexota bacterium]MCC6896317.1 LysE family translocator [Anaerolineae bacterium]
MLTDLLPTNVLLFVTASLALLISPGPNVMYIMTRSIDQGRTAGLVSVAGVASATMLHILAAALGLSAILLSSALAFDIVKYVGAVYLIYLGIQKFRSRDEDDTEVAVQKQPLGKIYKQGLIISLLNPKTALFFFAFLPQFVDPSHGSVTAQIILLGLIFIVLGALTDGTYAIVSSLLSGWLRGNRRFKRVQRYVSGTVFVGLGITAALAGRGKT